jgi:hypothetical protein
MLTFIWAAKKWEQGKVKEVGARKGELWPRVKEHQEKNP